jgi:hypothetical protein
MQITPQSKNSNIPADASHDVLESPDAILSSARYTGPSTASAKGHSSHAADKVETPPPSVPNYTNLSPDSLMAYCESRLNSLDTQMTGIFASQQKNATTTQDLNALASSLNDLPAVNPAPTPPTTTVSGPDYQAIVNQYNTAIDDAGKGTTLGNELGEDLKSFQAGVSKGAIPSDTVASLSQNLKNDTSSLNSDSEMTMINLQSLMTQRQTAVQLTTNLVQSLGEQTGDIAKNVGQ